MKIRFVCSSQNTLGGVATGDREVSLTAVTADAQNGGIKASGSIILSLPAAVAGQLVRGQFYTLELSGDGPFAGVPAQPAPQASAGVSASLDEHNAPINSASPPPSSNVATQRQIGPEQALGPRLPQAAAAPTVPPTQGDGNPSSEGSKGVSHEAAKDATKKPVAKNATKATPKKTPPAKPSHKK